MLQSSYHPAPIGFEIENGMARACTGQGLKNLLWAGTHWLEIHREVVNRLNVFPVPDGDTGTNMALTMRSALAEIETGPVDEVGSIAKRAAHGALMGARGNSGVILSQFWRGMADGLQGKRAFTAEDLAVAIDFGSQQAYHSVADPVEGTILTVARALAEAARSSANNWDLAIVLAGSVEAAKIAQSNTPELLPILKEAGVTDSGGQGLVYIFEGWLRFLRGEPLEEQLFNISAPVIHLGDKKETYGYDVQFLICGEGLDVETIRLEIDRMGRSTVVVGDGDEVKVHVHADNPQVVLDYGATLGRLNDVVVENLDRQAEKFIATVSSSRQGDERAIPTQGVVAVVAGWGLAEVFQSLGVCQIVPGGQTMNPSTQDLLAAVNEVVTKDVLILPNNRNIILAAQQAQRLSTKNVRVISTQTIPQGVAALLAFNQSLSFDQNVTRMTAAAQQVRTVEITSANRNTCVNGFAIGQGDLLAIVDGELKGVGRDDFEAARSALAQLNMKDEYEIITIYYGQDCVENRANHLAGQLETLYPDFEVEVIYGGQPHYHFIISVE